MAEAKIQLLIYFPFCFHHRKDERKPAFIRHNSHAEYPKNLQASTTISNFVAETLILEQCRWRNKNDSYIGKMKIVLATIQDYESIITFYDDVIDHTPDISHYARWSKGKHPTAEGIRAYIEEGSMYLYKEKERIVGTMAVTMYQGKDYHAIDWLQHVDDNEAAVIHILAVSPNSQGVGIGSDMIREAIVLAKMNGMKSIRLDALASNTPAHRIYERLGFEYRGKQHLFAENTGWTDFYFFELKKIKNMEKSNSNIHFTFNTVGLFTRDNKATVDFYTKTFGFTTDWDGVQPNVEMVLGDMRIILFPRDAFEQMVSQKFQYPKGFNGTVELAFDVPTFAEVDKAYKHALNQGAISVLPPTTEPWGQRTCYVADPDGNLIEIGSFTE